MKNFFLVLFSIALFSSCSNTSEVISYDFKNHLLPQPKEISTTNKALVLSERSKLYAEDDNLFPLLNLFRSELQSLTGHEIFMAPSNNREADIIFKFDTSLAREEYQLIIDENIKAIGGSYQALAMAKTSLLQLVDKNAEKLTFPVLSIHDSPDASYRGLMIDLARKWHEVKTIKKIIDLAAFYKINYVQLHFTDYQSYTLPSHKYPKLATPDRSYSFEELNELEAYSQLRGINIIPEVDIPGHSSPFVKMYPEIFAIKDTAENPWIINMGKEEVYEALDHIIGEVSAIFKSTPYFHIGGDEAIFYKVDQDPFVKAYMKENDLGDDIHELYRHFLVRINEIVKKHDKQMCVWEGFRNDGKVEIPKNIIVFEYETNRYLPNLLVEDGYTVVNASWKPLYVVNQKKWEPKTIYAWNIWRWENWFPKAPSFHPIQLDKTPLIIGAQMCAWEQAGEVEIPSLRKRLPALSERIWNKEEQISYDDFMIRMDQQDQKLSVLMDDFRQDSLLIDYNFVK